MKRKAIGLLLGIVFSVFCLGACAKRTQNVGTDFFESLSDSKSELETSKNTDSNDESVIEKETYSIVYYAVVNGKKQECSALPAQMFLEDGKYPTCYEAGVAVEISGLAVRYEKGRDVWLFYGWFTDEQCSNAFEEMTDLEKDYVLYAKIGYSKWSLGY